MAQGLAGEESVVRRGIVSLDESYRASKYRTATFGALSRAIRACATVADDPILAHFTANPCSLVLVVFGLGQDYN